MIIKQWLVEWTDNNGTTFHYYERSSADAIKTSLEARKQGFIPTTRKRTIVFNSPKIIKSIL